MSALETYDYQLFGLNVRSELPLPELQAGQWPGCPDVTINLGAVDRTSQPGISFLPNGVLLEIEEAGAFFVSGGNMIIVDPRPDVDPRNVRLYLLGSAFGALLHQRGILPLHANAIEIDGHAIAFMGESGAGKSTLAHWFHDRGHRVLSDDVCAVNSGDDGRAFAAAGIPRLRLWIDALERAGRTPDDLVRSYVDPERAYDKFDLPIAVDAGHPLPLTAIYVLERGEDFDIRALTGVDAVNAVFQHTYRGMWVAEGGSPFDHWEAAVGVARSIPIYRVVRPWDVAAIEEGAQRLLIHAREAIETSPRAANAGAVARDASVEID